MTVGETMAAASLGGSPGSGNPGGSGEPVASNENRSKTTGEIVPQTGPSMSMVTAKIGQELVTSLHLIKDIRRLEKYQRDFFLKVSLLTAGSFVYLEYRRFLTFFSTSFTG